ncbi:MAG TPA: FAD-dependent oxidoreductase [Candidatus Magasanikbacteria bacterium]|jgi:alkyl hydroperoxide reductase subunit AhpF|nr:FAD-dependent oxidoreductase [Candidatus Magasanikbacteria bacterium]HQF57551.1 FAD-dependent oxidoreductase [Candidatus Magasanikbacteria bacterium]HQL53005.1 FAD-dependent oxidoreductase [Candidatus Magasanikbacteria bacterium]
MKDLIIIGASAAGCSAAIYAARRNLNFEIISKDVGGEVSLSGKVNNWPGIIETSGFALAQTFRKHVESYGIKFKEGFEVTEIKPEKNYYIVSAKNFNGEEQIIETKAIIIATGIHPRSLNLPGEEEFRGKGITYCTVCDGPLFRGKTTVTIGAGNAALESALMMSELANKVYLLTLHSNTPENKSGFPSGEDILIEKVKTSPNIEIIYNAKTEEITGEQFVTGIKYKDLLTEEQKNLAVQGVMVHIGMVPNSNLINNIEKNPAGEIIIDQKCQTNLSGIFAAGDVTNIPFKQIAIAAGQGVTAALSAIEYINKWKN